MNDARIPLASHHPLVSQWVGSKPRVLILNRMDMIPPSTQQAWKAWFGDRDENPYFTNARFHLDEDFPGICKASFFRWKTQN